MLLGYTVEAENVNTVYLCTNNGQTGSLVECHMMVQCLQFSLLSLCHFLVVHVHMGQLQSLVQFIIVRCHRHGADQSLSIIVILLRACVSA